MMPREWLYKTESEKKYYETVKNVHRILGKDFTAIIPPSIISSCVMLGYPEGDDYEIIFPNFIPVIRPDYRNVNFGNFDRKNPIWVYLDNYAGSLRCYGAPLSDEQKSQLSRLKLTIIEEKTDS